ncbi:uncharacterized protein C6orf132 homolog [Gadus macrocephalus]|uniref:uncharacterized protein C6orf132 homolog n=1 Tax=Gadus macrocephalus TaxID=80720 RepID=UPI0028CB9AC2|nr:uncharacterized protein C6orf132 homolog [Gadus macrocephalus]
MAPGGDGSRRRWLQEAMGGLPALQSDPADWGPVASWEVVPHDPRTPGQVPVLKTSEDPHIELLYVGSIDLLYGPHIELLYGPHIEQLYVGSIEQLYVGSIEPLYVGSIEPLYVGSIEPLYVGVYRVALQQLYVGSIEQLYVGSIEQLYVGSIEQLYVGSIEQLYVGSIEQLYVGSIEQLYVGSIEQLYVGSIEPLYVGSIEQLYVGSIEQLCVGPHSGVLGPRPAPLHHSAPHDFSLQTKAIQEQTTSRPVQILPGSVLSPWTRPEDVAEPPLLLQAVLQLLQPRLLLPGGVSPPPPSSAPLLRPLCSGSPGQYPPPFSYVSSSPSSPSSPSSSSSSSSSSSDPPSSSCFSNLTYAPDDGSPDDGPPVTTPTREPHLLRLQPLHLGPFTPAPAAYQPPLHPPTEPQSPDSGISVGPQYLPEEGRAGGWEEQGGVREEEGGKCLNSLWEQGLSRVFLLAARSSPGAPPSTTPSPPSQPPWPWSPPPPGRGGG